MATEIESLELDTGYTISSTLDCGQRLYDNLSRNLKTGGGSWLLLQGEGVLLGEEAAWVLKRIVCDDISAVTTRYSINVPVDKMPIPS